MNFTRVTRSQRPLLSDAVARVDYTQQTDRKGLARNHRQVQRSREHVWVRNWQLGRLSIAAYTPVARQMTRIDGEAMQDCVDARYRVGGEGRLAGQQNFQVCRRDRRGRREMHCDRITHAATVAVLLWHYVVDDDVDQAVAAHLVRRFSDRIAAGAHRVARARNACNHLHLLPRRYGTTRHHRVRSRELDSLWEMTLQALHRERRPGSVR